MVRGINNLNLKRPIVSIDVETTGLNTSYDRIIELTVLKILPDGTEEQKSVRINCWVSAVLDSSGSERLG